MGALGSGFLVGNGYVITARHVIEGFQSFAAQFGQEYTKKALKIAVQMPVENERASFCGFDCDVVAEDERPTWRCQKRGIGRRTRRCVAGR